MFRAKYLGHLLFWGLFLALIAVYQTVGNTHGHPLRAWLTAVTELQLWLTVGTAVAVIYGSLWVFTRYPLVRLPLVLGQVIGLGVGAATLRYLFDWQVLPRLGQPFEIPAGGLGSQVQEYLLVSWVFVMLAFVFKQLRDNQQREALMHEKNAMELAYLKAQLNPHFLFNSMNNLYGLALTEPESTPDAILKLAELMRYMLYESNADRVSLRQEVEYLRSYIALEKLRYEGPFYLDFTIEGELDGRQIAPLLLICFVENAFKHGTVANPDQPLQLHLAVHGGQLTFTVRNQIVAKQKDLTGGIGLATVRRRLDLLYPGQHQLTITSSPSSYHCALELAVPALASPARPSFTPAPVFV